jgi:hypothetical protein
MKRRLFSWSLRIVVFLLLSLSILVTLVLNPSLVYAHKTHIGSFTILHNASLDIDFKLRLQEAAALVNKSEVANPEYTMRFCLGGSFYPALIKGLLGKGFAWGFYNIVVIKGQINNRDNRHEQGWNLSQLLAHEMTHCLQFDRYGLFKSNPLAGYPMWKWEGYAEYVARQSRDQKDLRQNIRRLQDRENTVPNGIIYFSDSSQTVIPYYRDWLLVQYCMDIKKMTYDSLLKNPTDAAILRAQMMQWHNGFK